MRTTDLHRSMRALLLTVAATLLVIPTLHAEELPREKKESKVTISGQMDLVSSYVFRGSHLAGASIQPEVRLGVGNFTVLAWGSVDFAATSYKEVDILLQYQIKGLTISLGDLYDEGSPNRPLPDDISRNYFDFSATSPHCIELGLIWQVSQKVPITLSWYTQLFGARDSDAEGKRYYSTYVEVAYPFAVKGVDMNVGVGAAPWRASMGNEHFAVRNVFIHAAKTWQITKLESFRLGLFTQLCWSPYLQDVNLVGGIRLCM